MAYSILIIDDDLHFLNSLRYILENNDYTVVGATTGTQALKLLQQQHFDASFVDLHLPDASGEEIADYIKSRHDHLAVIIMTGYASLDSALYGLRTGISDYLCKPTHPEIILNTLARCLENNRLRQEIIASEKRFRQLAEVTCEGILLIRDEEIYQANSQFSQLFGYQEEELSNVMIGDLLPDWHNSPFHQQIDNHPDAPSALESVGRHKSGARFPVEVRVKQLSSGQKTVLAVGIQDISERKENEQKFFQLQEKLGLAKRMESLGLMAGSVAHDLNNILSGLISYPDLLLSDMDTDAPFREELELIKNSGQQAFNVVNELLRIARGAKCKKEETNINLLIKNYQSSLDYRQLHHEFYDLQVDFELDPTLPDITCSAIHITQTLSNLVTNAAEASNSSSGRIRIRTTTQTLDETVQGFETIPPGSYVILSVTDNGPGIQTKSLSQIFEPFYTEKLPGRSGTGLGLTIIWNAIRDHDGFINLSSSNRGTRFELYFPISLDQKSGKTLLPSEYLSGNDECILVVDDEKIQLEIARNVLMQLGYQVITAESGEEALDYLRSHSVDLVILDMVMENGMNGYETYAAIQQIKPAQKALVASGYYEPGEEQKIINLGINQYLTKPYSAYCLGRAIRQELISRY
jgi:PAS domain S-box-containing protein